MEKGNLELSLSTVLKALSLWFDHAHHPELVEGSKGNSRKRESGDGFDRECRGWARIGTERSHRSDRRAPKPRMARLIWNSGTQEMNKCKRGGTRTNADGADEDGG